MSNELLYLTGCIDMLIENFEHVKDDTKNIYEYSMAEGAKAACNAILAVIYSLGGEEGYGH